MVAVILAGCPAREEIISNPWLVPFKDRHGSAISRSQMRSMVRLGHFYRDNGLGQEYEHAMVTAVELYAGDIEVTFELLNIMIDRINAARREIGQVRNALGNLGIDPGSVGGGYVAENDEVQVLADGYIEANNELEALYEETYRILSSACGQIPYNAELYYRTAHLQFLRAEEDGDRDKYKDAINFLKRAIASDSSHLESYHLIAVSYERMGDDERAKRFWRLFEVIYEIAPQTMGPGFVTPHREGMHEEALARLEVLESDTNQ